METISRNHANLSPRAPNIPLKIALTAILSAVGFVLSWVNPFAYMPIAGVKINPFAHLINVIAGVLLGPGYAVLCAGVIATLRFSFGIGSLAAFPGGMSGALIVGVVREVILRIKPHKVHWAGLFEPVGTVCIGASLSSLLLPVPIATLMLLFAFSCIPGAILGWVLLNLLEKMGWGYSRFIPQLNSEPAQVVHPE